VAVDRELKSNTSSLTVKALFPNPDHLLLPGMFARVRLTGQVIPNALLVPERAIQQILNKTFVLVVGADGKSVAKSVELGDKIGSYYVVKSGLSAEDNVIVEGLSSLTEGMDLDVTMVTPEDMGFSLDEEDDARNDDSTKSAADKGFLQRHRKTTKEAGAICQNSSFIARSFAIVVSLIIVIAGAISGAQLPIAQYPQISPPTVQRGHELHRRERRRSSIRPWPRSSRTRSTARRAWTT
jgi:hypothetical protein